MGYDAAVEYVIDVRQVDVMKFILEYEYNGDQEEFDNDVAAGDVPTRLDWEECLSDSHEYVDTVDEKAPGVIRVTGGGKYFGNDALWKALSRCGGVIDMFGIGEDYVMWLESWMHGQCWTQELNDGEVLTLLQERNTPHLAEVQRAADPHTPVDELHQLAEADDPRLCAVVAANPTTDERTLLALATHTDSDVRQEVVNNPTCPSNVAAIAALSS